MDDLISRQEAIDALMSWVEEHKDNAFDGCLLHWTGIKALLENLPSERQEQRWVPVSERLPEKNGRYLVTNTQWGAYEVDWNIFYKEPKEGWLWEKGVTAWMPLPEPYKEKQG